MNSEISRYIVSSHRVRLDWVERGCWCPVMSDPAHPFESAVVFGSVDLRFDISTLAWHGVAAHELVCGATVAHNWKQERGNSKIIRNRDEHNTSNTCTCMHARRIMRTMNPMPFRGAATMLPTSARRSPRTLCATSSGVGDRACWGSWPAAATTGEMPGKARGTAACVPHRHTHQHGSPLATALLARTPPGPCAVPARCHVHRPWLAASCEAFLRLSHHPHARAMCTRAGAEVRGEQQQAAAAVPFGPTAAPPTAPSDGSGAADDNAEQKQRTLTAYVKPLPAAACCAFSICPVDMHRMHKAPARQQLPSLQPRVRLPCLLPQLLPASTPSCLCFRHF